MGRQLAGDLSEDRSDLAETDIVRHDLEINASGLGWVVKNPEVVGTNVTERYQWNLHVTAFNKS